MGLQYGEYRDVIETSRALVASARDTQERARRMIAADRPRRQRTQRIAGSRRAAGHSVPPGSPAAPGPATVAREEEPAPRSPAPERA